MARVRLGDLLDDAVSFLEHPGRRYLLGAYPDLYRGPGLGVRSAAQRPRTAAAVLPEGLRRARSPESGLGYTILRPQLFMQNFLRLGPSIAAAGRFAAPMGERRFAFVDVRDVARVAAAALTEEAHAGATYVVSGPEVLSYGDAARTIGAAIGKEVAYEPAEPQAFRDALVAERGLPRWRADELAFIASAYGEGEGELVTDVVRRVGGNEPRTFAEFAREHADHFAKGLSHHM
jgi:hypothetical protein